MIPFVAEAVPAPAAGQFVCWAAIGRPFVSVVVGFVPATASWPFAVACDVAAPASFADDAVATHAHSSNYLDGLSARWTPD